MNHAVTTTVDDRSVSESVVEAVAEAEGVAPSDLRTALYGAVDPDALEQLFAPRPTVERLEGCLTFRYHGYEVTVRSGGSVTVCVTDA
jgi:hypothetical protein